MDENGIDLTGITDADIRDYLDEIGYKPDTTIDTTQLDKIATDKFVAGRTGNDKLSNTLDFILKYLDKGLTIAAKTGLIGKAQAASTFPSLAGLKTDTKDDVTNNAPPPDNRIFGIDFTDPKVLIIVFFIILTLFYFLFFNKPESKKAR